jgi:hypothetical protein
LPNTGHHRGSGGWWKGSCNAAIRSHVDCTGHALAAGPCLLGTCSWRFDETQHRGDPVPRDLLLEIGPRGRSRPTTCRRGCRRHRRRESRGSPSHRQRLRRGRDRSCPATRPAHGVPGSGLLRSAYAEREPARGLGHGRGTRRRHARANSCDESLHWGGPSAPQDQRGKADGFQRGQRFKAPPDSPESLTIARDQPPNPSGSSMPS